MAGHLDTEQARALAAMRKNPGRQPRTEEEEIKKALRKAIPEAEVLERLAALCRGRNSLPAITLYLAYLWGKPVETKEISGPSGQPMQFAGTVAPVGAEALLAILEASGLVEPGDSEDAEADGVHAADDLGEAGAVSGGAAS